MAVVRTHSASALGRWEPSLAHTFLPGCRQCGERHPLAFKVKPADLDHCPGCGAEVAPPGQTVKVPAKGGLVIWLANAMQAIARALHRLAERI